MKKMICCLVLMGFPLSAVDALAASELDLAISSDFFAADYSMVNEERGSLWGVGATYNEDVEATAVSATFNVVGDALATDEIRTGLGVKGVVHDTFQTGVSIAIGGTAEYAPARFSGFGVEGQVYYAPEILNTNDAEQYYELLARVTYAVHPDARVFVGWANKTVKYDDAPVREVEINSALNLGVILNF